MSQVTIYLPPSTLEAAKAAAARAQLSVSQWFAQFAQAEEKKNLQQWPQFLDALDASYGSAARDDLDFLLRPERDADLPPQRETAAF